MDHMQMLCSSLIKQCKKTRQYGKYFLFFHWQLAKLGGQGYWGQYELYVAQLHYHCLISALKFLPDFPTTLQLNLPFGWAADNPEVSYFFAVLHALFCSINLCVIPCMSEIFLKSHIISVAHTFPLTFYLTEYFHCYGKGVSFLVFEAFHLKFQNLESVFILVTGKQRHIS